MNIGKYRQLVQAEIQSLNRQVGVEKEGRAGLDSKYLLEELMRHNFSKKWIDEESSSLSDRERQSSNANNADPPPEQLSPSTFPKLSRNEDDESLDDSQGYDRNKYEMNSLEEAEAARSQEASGKKREPIDMQWINSQLHDEVIVKNYLDCGLEKFALSAEEREGSSDEAIGERFERANIAILRRREERRTVGLPVQLAGEKAEEVVGVLVNGLLDEFAVGTPRNSQTSRPSSRSATQPCRNARRSPRLPGPWASTLASTRCSPTWTDSSSSPKVAYCLSRPGGRHHPHHCQHQ